MELSNMCIHKIYSRKMKHDAAYFFSSIIMFKKDRITTEKVLKLGW